ncbi:hypothetical protein RhiirC2_865552 [Rhizophagus irregularis]|uniref:DUF659 domain-containing protein n=1 Tax=Rhizophagus irregularis TaxID=588596 RepID=A0A2N1NC97_9GLOM|nr:hypothetical protein RhiirC2_865552 [Rhizophagus irregularis]
MVRQNNKSKGKAGRKQDEVWEYFEKKALKSPSHFLGECQSEIEDYYKIENYQKDYSSSHHTGEFLTSEIKTIIEKISAKKFSAIVTDNAANVRLARELVTQEYPKILNLRCIAHFINSITKSILDHSITTKILAACNTIAKFFKTSHICHNLLSEYAKNLEIEGGGLKCFIKTR